MYYPELSRECQIAAGDAIRAVGWLCAAHPFASGAVPPDFVESVRRLVRLGWCPVATAGSHACEFCVGAQVRESANVLVPGSGVLYIAPAMVTHYVEAHGYQPPTEFVAAVLSCPEGT